MNVDRNHNPHICVPYRVDAWDEVVIKHEGKNHKNENKT